MSKPAAAARAASFRREKFVPKEARMAETAQGGDVIIKAVGSRRTLLDLKYQQHHMAKRGQQGEGNNRTGRSSEIL